jgi:hypothetical protein
MFYSDIFAARPNFGIAGRIFISTDTAAIYRDTGSAWDLISDATGTGTNIYNSDGTLTGNRTVSSGGFNLTFNPRTSFITTLTAANNDSSLASYSQNNLSIGAGFSSNNIGAIYGALAGVNLQTFAGSATFAQANVASASLGVNSIDFSSAGSTITMTQAAGIRAMAGNIAQVQYQGTNSGTITHAAIQQNLGFYRPSAATGTLTITNAYSHLINALDDYGAGFTFTNRWGIYQAGASDKNYFAAHMILGSTTDNGNRLQITGNQYLSGNLTIGSTSGIYRIDIISSGGAFETIRINNAFTGASDGSQLLLGNSANFTNAFFRLNGGGNSSQGGVGSLNIGLVESAPIAFFTGNTQRATINSSGNLQLGTTSGGNWRFLCYQNASTGLASSSSLLARQDGTDDIVQFWAGASNIASIKSTGNLLIGTTVDTGEKLQVNGNGYFSGRIESTGLFAHIVRGRASDNFGGIGFYANTGNTRYGYVQSGSTNGGQLVVNGDGGGQIIMDSRGVLLQATSGNVSIGSSSSTGNKLYLNGSLRIDGQTSGTAGGSSGQHLIINCDGTTYKIALLNN